MNEYIHDKENYEYLFKSRKGTNQPISAVQAWRIIKGAAKVFLIECVATHSMRKTYGYIIYILSEKDPVAVKEALNQGDVSSALRYIGVRQDMVDKHVKKLGDYISQKRK
ncbi:hypothetical protein [Clostridium formicaceticum]|uniref:hypothetical protein n=1 Tax=Clostridium formicaceticum TaxID=1497 RepID=UPI0030026A22